MSGFGGVLPETLTQKKSNINKTVAKVSRVEPDTVTKKPKTKKTQKRKTLKRISKKKEISSIAGVRNRLFVEPSRELYV